MNLRPGIDTPQPSNILLVKLNLPFDDRSSAMHVLQSLEKAIGSIRGSDLNTLIGFGLRFFLGPLEQRAPEEVIPNFPPAGVFEPRTPTRFNITKHKVPLYLRTMNAAGDQAWVEKRKQDYQQWLSEAESDLILKIECSHRPLIHALWQVLYKEVIQLFGLEIVSKQFGENPGDSRVHLGWKDGESNLQDVREKDPQTYRSKIFLPHPAPAYPGESNTLRDETLYDGGTYMVHRKYIEHLDRWHDDKLSFKDEMGCVHKGLAAQNRIIGREYKTGKVISRMNDQLLDKEYDSQEVNLAHHHSHILKSRGGRPAAPFIGPFPPLKPGEEHSFSIQDIRILRRGYNYEEIDPVTHKTTVGLHFICFQNNIQQTGFEFINNIWLLNPCFRKHVDQLMDVEAGIIEPVEGCYYFIPPAHRRFAGDIFFTEE